MMKPSTARKTKFPLAQLIGTEKSIVQQPCDQILFRYNQQLVFQLI